ncbi:MAG: hypothetical protein AMS24_02800 [Chlamydiae bacterium SM23_39]|nr:MAG: hypothetical protein AMS24_02800 [Chlamydiae bacterium SM23_39]
MFEKKERVDDEKNYRLGFTTSISIEIVKAIAKSLYDPSKIMKDIIIANRLLNLEGKKNIEWNDLSISSGYPGGLLLFAELQKLFPNEEFDGIVYDYIVKIIKSIESKPISNLSLFNGLTGCCFAIQQASLDGTRYQKVLKPLHDFIIKHLESTYLIPFKSNLKPGFSIRMDIYDLMHGIIGVGFYCLKNLEIPSFNYLVGEIISTLLNLKWPVIVNGYKVPRWYLDQGEAMKYEEEYPSQRYFNLSMSHGITGVLAFLSLAHQKGYIINGMEEVIVYISTWIQQKRRKVDNLFYWDKGISFSDETTHTCSSPVFWSDAWDCGTPGIARTLYLTGLTIKNEELIQYALQSFISVFDKNRLIELPKNPFFSKGTSGLYMLTNLMARDSKSTFLEQKTIVLKDILLNQLSEYTPQDYQNKNSLDILNGIPGALLTLLSSEYELKSWYSPFLIDWI